MVVRVLILTTIPIIYLGLFYYAKRSNYFVIEDMTKTSFTVKQHPGIFYIALVASLGASILFILMLTVLHNETVTPVTISIFSGFCIMTYLLLYWIIRERLVVQNNIVYVTPIVGRIKEYKITDIEYVKPLYMRSVNGIKCYINDKKVFDVSSSCIGYTMMLERVKNVPIRLPRKWVD